MKPTAVIETLRRLARWLDGRKSYIGWIAAGILGLFWSSGLISDEHAKIAASLIATWTGVAMRHAIAKSGQAAQQQAAVTITTAATGNNGQQR